MAGCQRDCRLDFLRIADPMSRSRPDALAARHPDPLPDDRQAGTSTLTPDLPGGRSGLTK